MSQTNIKVRELVDKVSRGELVLPEMQRGYVWSTTRVRDLFDSLYRGYPSGTILVWETDADIETRQLALKSSNTPTISQRLLLLDGQQRVTSLSAVIDGKPLVMPRGKRPIEILFNLEHPEGPPVDMAESEDRNKQSNSNDIGDDDSSVQAELKKRTFVVSSRSLKNDPLWVPVSDVFKKTESQILKSININSDDDRWDKYSERLQRVKKIADYTYIMEVLEKNMSYEEVTEIFVRVNSSGIKLRGSDLALAQITSRWKGFMEELEGFAKEFKQNENYIIESGLLVRLLVVFATQQSRFKTVGKISQAKLAESWKSVKEGLHYAVNFLRNNAGIDSLNDLSSPFLVVPISVFWVMKNSSGLTDDEEKKILRWFYLAHMWGHYSSSTETILDADLNILFKNQSLNELIEKLSLHVKKFVVDENDIAHRGIRSSFFSMLYFVLKQNGVKDWSSGLQIAKSHTGHAHAMQYHHIFPKTLLKEYEKKEINEIANMAFIDGRTNRQITNKSPENYFESEVITKRGEEGLSSHLIPIDKSLWKISAYRDFLSYRRNAIAHTINSFMQKFE